MNIKNNLTETDNHNIDVKSQSEHRIRIQGTKESSWIIDKINSSKKIYCKTGELNGSIYVKIPLRSSALKKYKKNDKYCFVWSILASVHPCNSDHPNRVSKYKQYYKVLNNDGFDFDNGFKLSDMHSFEKLNSLSINMFELNFYQDKKEWKHYWIPIEISKNQADRVVDLIIYKNHYARIKKLNVFLGDHHKTFMYRRCLKSYTSENMLILHEPKCENNDITTIRTQSESHLHRKYLFQKNPLWFRIYADFEADNEIENLV